MKLALAALSVMALVATPLSAYADGEDDFGMDSGQVVAPDRPLGANEFGITGLKPQSGSTQTGESQMGDLSELFGGNTNMSQTFNWRQGEFGHRIAGDDGSMKSTALMNVMSGGQSVRTYCADVEVPVRAEMGGLAYQESAASSARNKGQIGWIVKNTYPSVSLNQLSQVTGGNISKQEAITASQAAIWHYTNGFNLRKVAGESFIGLDLPLFGLGGGSGDGNVKKLYEHLISSASTQSSSSINTLAVKVTGSSFNKGLVGPIVISGDAQSTVKAQVTGGTLVDESGKAVSLTAIPVNQKLYLKVTQNSGSANISVAGTVKVNSGRIFTGAHGVRTQAQVGVDTYTRPDKATGTVTWNSGGSTAGQDGGEDVPPTTTTIVKPNTGTKTPTGTTGTTTGSKKCDDSNATATKADDCTPATSGEECDSNNSTADTSDDCTPPVTQPTKGCDDSNATATKADDCQPAEPVQIKQPKRIARSLADTGAGSGR